MESVTPGHTSWLSALSTLTLAHWSSYSHIDSFMSPHMRPPHNTHWHTITCCPSPWNTSSHTHTHSHTHRYSHTCSLSKFCSWAWHQNIQSRPFARLVHHSRRLSAHWPWGHLQAQRSPDEGHDAEAFQRSVPSSGTNILTSSKQRNFLEGRWCKKENTYPSWRVADLGSKPLFPTFYLSNLSQHKLSML